MLLSEAAQVPRVVCAPGTVRFMVLPSVSAQAWQVMGHGWGLRTGLRPQANQGVADGLHLSDGVRVAMLKELAT